MAISGGLAFLGSSGISLSNPTLNGGAWTRLGYTYDWADNGRKYGLSEFLINKNAKAQVAFIESTQEFVTQLADDRFTDLAEQNGQNALAVCKKTNLRQNKNEKDLIRWRTQSGIDNGKRGAVH